MWGYFACLVYLHFLLFVWTNGTNERPKVSKPTGIRGIVSQPSMDSKIMGRGMAIAADDTVATDNDTAGIDSVAADNDTAAAGIDTAAEDNDTGAAADIGIAAADNDTASRGSGGDSEEKKGTIA